jgi:AraC-like DNA-binding protein
MVNQSEIAERLRRQWKELLPHVRLLRMQNDSSQGFGEKYDLLVDIQVGDVRRQLACELKSVGEPRYLHQAISQLKTVSTGREGIVPVIVAPHISEEGRRLCRDVEVGYIDLTGNVFLQFDSVLIERTSSRTPATRMRATSPDIFAPKSSRMLRVLLENPGKPWTVSDMSKEAGVSLGLVHRVVKALTEKGYVDKKWGAISLVKPAELLDSWAERYRLDGDRDHTYYSFRRSFSTFAADLEALAQRAGFTYAFTSHAGASLVAPFVRFTDAHFYFSGDVEAVVSGLDLRPVEMGGTLHLLTPYDAGVFYRVQRVGEASVVCNTQLYLDLFNYPARGREQAQFLRQQTMSF